MKSAVIGRVEGDLQRVESLRRHRAAEREDLLEQVEVTGVKRTADGLDITQGRAASQEQTTEEQITLDPDTIRKERVTETNTKYTDFIAVPSEFVGIATNEGSFLFDLLERDRGVPISRVDVDIDDFAGSFPKATPWKVGFYEHGNNAENGVIHGENVLEDEQFGGALASSKKNQLGLRMTHDGQEFKMLITRSGYVSVYEPTNLDTAQFAQFVIDKILPHTD